VLRSKEVDEARTNPEQDPAPAAAKTAPAKTRRPKTS
jgi:hypothetical protein